MEGYKTNLANGVMAVLSLIAAFGIEVTEEQRVAILTFMTTVVWPTAMFIMRALTKGPMKLPGRSSTAKTPWWVVVLLLPVFWLSGCSSNPLSVADSAEQQAFAAYGTFVVLEERAAALMGEPSVPDSAKARIQSLDARLKPMADSLKDSALLVADVRADLEAGDTTEDRLQTVTAELEDWLTRFMPMLAQFQQAVRR